MINRVITIVLDGFGVGESPDAHVYGDEGSNTIAYNINQNMNNKKTDVKSSRKTHFETEPTVNIRNFNNRRITSDNNRQPFIPERNIMNKENFYI